MPELSPRVLLAVADLTEVLVLRRLLRDMPVFVDVARSGFHALRAMSNHSYAAIITDDDKLEGMSGRKLLAEVARAQPEALRILLADKEQRRDLADGVGTGKFRVAFRPYFASHIRSVLIERLGETAVKAAGGGDEAIDADTNALSLKRSSEPTERRQLLLTLAELVEAKSGIAPGHAVRVAALAGALGVEARLDETQLEALEEAALVHDVGELAVATELLQLHRRLTPHERRQLRRHTEAGYRVARRCGLSKPVQSAVRHHHERWDGRGYPDKLSGVSIPLLARVVAVADVWDALATSRPYRRLTSVSDCARTIMLLGGTQLDGDLVQLFVSRKLYRVINWADPPRGSGELLGPAQEQQEQ
jgi:HD-GYP domain-containing protein (c-di-GMP phosphodiesterase class II)